MTMQMDRRFLLRAGALAAGASAFGGEAHAARRREPRPSEGGEADYVVVGSGPGGAPLAARLAAAGHSVIVLEAGPPAGNRTWYDTPGLHNRASAADTAVRWDFYVEQYTDPAMSRTNSQWVHDRGVLYPRASTLGGCTAHHAQITMHPDPCDWAFVQQLTGDASWRPEAMWQHWESLLKWNLVEFPPLVEALKIDSQLRRIMNAAVDEAARLPGGNIITDHYGANKPENVGGGRQGYLYAPQMNRGGRRYGPREILHTASQQFASRMTIRTGTLARRILFAGGPDGRPRAVGVECMVGDHLYAASPLASPGRAYGVQVFRARKEVILACGAFNSPQLLMLSGIGPRAHLARHGIPVVVDLPGVGGNLQDRYEVSIVTHHRPFALLASCSFGKPLDPCLAADKGLGLFGFSQFSPYSISAGTGGVKRRYGADPRAQLYVFGAPADFRGYKPGFDSGYVNDKFSWLVLKGYAASRMGTVRLRSADPVHPPYINFRKFDDGAGGHEDVAAVVDSMAMVRRINTAAGAGTEVWPGPQVSTPEQLAQWVRKEAWGHHASCSNPIGPDGDPDAVLDSRFRVRGTIGLRVVDASAFPRIPGLFIWAPTAIISEKAAHDILSEARL
ncbi:GMC family oxidoreductase [Sinosporangium siamense]|uniref:GMC family oxidoreductase n=1 Tax=Sinosporangium siamense TaxID=1367973 RepID=A0A919RDW8_9ACTN|nr:GMC oxidoreductase [Sinosporangium siamense]GII91823.1 GMC family oxidoreductase [Sinosporangium siamense]